MTTRRFEPVLEIKDAPPLPTKVDVTLEPPEELPKVAPTAVWRMVFPLILVGGMVGMFAMMFRMGGFNNPYMLMLPLMMVGSMAYMFQGGGNGQQKGTAELNAGREDYLIHLADKREVITDAERTRFDYQSYWFAEPALLASVVGTERQWRQTTLGAGHARKERLPVRVARGRTLSAVGSLKQQTLEGPEAAPADMLDPLGQIVVSKFVRAHRTVDDVVITLDLGEYACVVAAGDAEATRSWVRAVIGNLAVYNSPSDVRIAAILENPAAQQWDWLKWLPHTQISDRYDTAGTARAVFTNVEDLKASLPDIGQRGRFSHDSDTSGGAVPHVAVIVDSPEAITDLSSLGKVTWIVLASEDTDRHQFDRLDPYQWLTINADGELSRTDRRGRTKLVGRADQLDLVDAEVTARRLSRWRTDGVGMSATESVIADDSWEALVGIRDAGALVPQKVWGTFAPTDRSRLRVALGRDEHGRPVVLDLKEVGQKGHGPHGLLIGFTGAGKSELLRTIILGLVATHSPDDLNLLLIDYKDGGAFSGFEVLNHVLAVVTNMEEEASLVARFEDVMRGEGERRGRILREAGLPLINRHFESVTEYNEYRLAHPEAGLKPIPALLIIVDEYTELLTKHPEFADVFNGVGRQGRSQWIHFLLATQAFDSGKGRGLEENMSYRIALKTQTAANSREVIGVPDAYHLNQAGSGYFMTSPDPNELVKFQAPYTGIQYRAPEQDLDAAVETPAQRRALAGYVEPVVFGNVGQALPEEPAAEVVSGELDATDEDESGPDDALSPVLIDGVEILDPSVRGVVLHRLAGQGSPPRPMWLTPINTPRPLNDALALANNQFQYLQFPIGIVDVPRRHAQQAWTFDAFTGGGHLAIAGAGQMGKTTLIEALILGAAVTHSPEQVQFYCIDPGGRLGVLDGLPHVGAVARTPEHQRRVLATAMSLMATRTAKFAELEIHGGLPEYLQRRAADPQLAAEDPYGEVFLVVDGLDILVSEETSLFADDKEKFGQIAIAGADVGVHLIVASSNWQRLGPVSAAIINRIELRLTDHHNSALSDGAAAARELPPVPGRALANNSNHKQPKMVALPRLDGVGDPSTIVEGLVAAIEQVRAAYPDARPAPAVQVLPEVIPIGEILQAARVDPSWERSARMRIPFGVAEQTLAPVAVDLYRGSHMAIYGSAGSGKSTVLAAVVKGIVDRLGSGEAQFMLVDPRRQHSELVPKGYLVEEGGYMTTASETEPVMAALAEKLRHRIPQHRISPKERKERSWWSGPEVFLVIDDYHMLVTGTGGWENPFKELIEAVQQGNDIGFHVLVTRAMQQAAVAAQGGILGPIKGMSAPGMVLDGDRLEGPLVGTELRPAVQKHRGRGYFIDPLRQYDDVVQAGWVDLDQD